MAFGLLENQEDEEDRDNDEFGYGDDDPFSRVNMVGATTNA